MVIVLAVFLILALGFLLIFLFKNFNKKSFISEDGSVFDSQSALDSYQILLKKTKPLFFTDEQNKTNIPVLGFEKSFLTKLVKEGFSDFKTLFKYRKQIKTLSDLINT